MTSFTNRATLSFGEKTVNSNVTKGELREVLTATKTAALNVYDLNGDITYVISIINTGTSPFTGLKISDNLGAFDFSTEQLVPLDYVKNSALFYINGEIESTPAVTGGPPLLFSNVDIPAGSEAILIYRARINEFAPRSTGSTIINEARIFGGNLANDITVTETVTAQNQALLSISKALSPTTITENGQISYTFTISNMGNAETGASIDDNVILKDVFKPILNPMSVRYESIVWELNNQYTYNVLNGEFATNAGFIIVPAATYQRSATGEIITTPGVRTITVTGTI